MQDNSKNQRRFPLSRNMIEYALLARLTSSEIPVWLEKYGMPFRELMAYYRCAIMEVETKFNVLNEEFSLAYDRNPIETVKSRLKSPQSIVEKLGRRQLPLTVESIEQNLDDIAGVRVICAFTSDIYRLADIFLQQDDITLLKRKDYIRNPKPSGYRSLHLIVEIPIFLHDCKRPMKVEVQLRTLSMDCWASLEHKIRYKKDLDSTTAASISEQLQECAELSAQLDGKMQKIMQITAGKDGEI